jgi:site-specific DNA-methyltransferase (adenine-specific)
MTERRVVDIGPARLILGDAYEERPALGFKDADIMDPPYLIATSGGGKLRKSRTYLNDLADQGLADDFDHSIINGLLCGSAAVFCSNDQLPALLPYLNGTFHRFSLGFIAKRNPLPVANLSMLSDVEPVIRCWNRGHHPVGEIMDKRKGMIVDHDGYDEAEFVENMAVESKVTPSKAFGHPTVKPLEIMRRLVRTTNGEEIVDSFMGTGTTGIACILEGKRFIGIEKDEKHFDTACRRIEEALRSLEAA